MVLYYRKRFVQQQQKILTDVQISLVYILCTFPDHCILYSGKKSFCFSFI